MPLGTTLLSNFGSMIEHLHHGPVFISLSMSLCFSRSRVSTLTASLGDGAYNTQSYNSYRLRIVRVANAFQKDRKCSRSMHNTCYISHESASAMIREINAAWTAVAHPRNVHRDGLIGHASRTAQCYSEAFALIRSSRLSSSMINLSFTNNCKCPMPSIMEFCNLEKKSKHLPIQRIIANGTNSRVESDKSSIRSEKLNESNFSRGRKGVIRENSQSGCCEPRVSYHRILVRAPSET